MKNNKSKNFFLLMIWMLFESLFSKLKLEIASGRADTLFGYGNSTDVFSMVRRTGLSSHFFYSIDKYIPESFNNALLLLKLHNVESG